jgi:replication factor C small subunit
MEDRNLWEFKYEPKKFDSMILNESVRASLGEALKTRPNMLIYGPPGVGKGTFVNIVINHHGLKGNFLKINGSDETGIDVMRDKVKEFAQAMSIGKMKLVYLNEADSLTKGEQGSQKMLRDLIEMTQANTQWILCCNYEQYIIPELKSRCQTFELASPPAVDIFKFCEMILKTEGIKYSSSAVVNLVKKCYPDIRSTIITLRQNVIDGVLAKEIVQSNSQKVFDEILFKMNVDPTEVRKSLKSHAIHYEGLYAHIFEHLMDESSDRVDVFNDEANAVVHLGEASYRNNVVANKEINFMHMYFKMIQDKTIKLG